VSAARTAIDVAASLEHRLAELDRSEIRRRYLEADELVFIEDFLPADLLEHCLLELDTVLPHVHRNFIPRHKKGGAVGFDTLSHLAPTIRDLYLDAGFIEFVREICGEGVDPCPGSDLHRCALYCYTEPGDHIGYHYDNSYYLDRRYTVLLGLRDESSCKLACRLHTRNDGVEPVEFELATPPGSLVIFNGDKVQHAVTPLGQGEARHVITMQYVTDAGMHPFLRFVSDMKDAIAYFGFRKVFSRERPPAGPAPDQAVRD